MKAGVSVIALAALALTPSIGRAGAWVQPRGDGQVILKYESMRADAGFDPTGVEHPLLEPRRDASLGVFAEYGLTPRLTLQIKGDWQDGRDAFVDYEGRGPIEAGLTWQVWRDDANAVSLYGGYADAGEGRNAGYAQPGVGEHDWEARVSVGRSLTSTAKRLGIDHAFVEVQAARRLRDGLPDETRMDATAGARFGGGDWMVLAQTFGGAADGGARWLNLEASLVRDLGPWSVQAGWRQTVAGQETPVAQGPVLAIWRRF